MTLRYSLFLCAALVTISAPDPARGQEAKPTNEKDHETRFMRLVETDLGPQALQTAITRYQRDGENPATVDLVGAVHIGERVYYQTLNELLSDYDVVLYELVAPEGTRIPRGGRKHQSNHPVALLQVSAQKFLGLESQLQCVDYTSSHFRHADLSPNDLAENMKQRGDTTLSLVVSTLTEVLNQAGQNSPNPGPTSEFGIQELTELATDPLKAKRFMAMQLDHIGSMENGLGSKLNQLIVKDRNKAAMKVLDEVLSEISAADEERRPGKIAIFYGAAHMPDFDERLQTREFQKTAQSWVTAWDLTRSHARPRSDHPMSLLMELMKAMDQ